MSNSTRLRAGMLVWLAMLGLDFLLNAGVFAPLYQHTNPFLLPAAEAFRRIPLGYLAFLIVAFAVVELAHRLGVTGTAGGVRLGLVLGAVVGAAWALSVYSIATVALPVAAAMAVTWIALLVLSSVVAAAALRPGRLRRRVLAVVGFDIASLVVVVGLQSLGIVPTVNA